MKWLLALIFAVAVGGAVSSRAATNDFFARGIAAARAGEFSDAAAAFQNAARRQPAAGALVNLGLAEWQRGHAGAAILAWERARWIDPFDGRAAQNLRFARAAAQVDEPAWQWFEAVSLWLPPAAWLWLAGASLTLTAAALILPGVFRRKKSGGQQMLAALSGMIFLFSLTANLGVVSRAQLGFVLAKNAPLLLTPTHEGEVISTLNAGEPARRLRTRGDFYFIATANGSGWMEAKAFGLVNAR
jgi:tetratricopeptide (TPR) repeat protein